MTTYNPISEWLNSDMNRQIFNINFWKRQTKAVIYIVIAIAIVLFLIPYATPIYGDPITYISGVIFLVFILGFYHFVRLLVRLEEERKFIEDTRSLANKALRENNNITLAQLRAELPRKPNLFTNRMIEHIFTEAEVRKFESSIVTVQNYKDDFYSRIFKIGTIKTVALQMGVLGTFLGLMRSFQSMGGSGVDINIIKTALQSAFITSIAGLGASVILGLFIMLLREKQDVLFHIMETATDRILTLVRKADNAYKANDFLEVNNHINQLADSVSSQSESLEHQTNVIMKGIAQLKRSEGDFNDFLGEISNTQTIYLAEINKIYQKFSPDAISEELKKSLALSVENMSSHLGENLATTLTKYDKLNDSFNLMNENMKTIHNQLQDQIKFGNEDVNKSKKEMYESLQKLTDIQNEFVASVSDVQISTQLKDSILTTGEKVAKQYKEEATAMLKEVKSLNKELKNYNETATEEIRQQAPAKIFTQILTLTGKWFSSTFRWLGYGVKKSITFLKTLKK